MAVLLKLEPGTSQIRNRNISQYCPTLEHSRGEKTQQRPPVDFKKQLTVFFLLGPVFSFRKAALVDVGNVGAEDHCLWRCDFF